MLAEEESCRFWRPRGLCVAFALLIMCGVVPTGVARAANWTVAGQNISNSRTQPSETVITPTDAAELAPKWTFTTHGNVSATPTVYGGIVYFPDNGGYLNAISATTGRLIWQRRVSSYDGTPMAFARVSPAVYGKELIVGDNFHQDHPGGAHMFAVNRLTGRLLWSTSVDTHRAAHITSNPIIAAGKVIVGISSNEEGDASDQTYPCCTFRGSVVAIDATTGSLLWKTYTVPPNPGPCRHPDPAEGCGYSGGAVWDTPAVSLVARTVYVATGNNYTVPDQAEQCQKEAVESDSSDAACTAPDDYFDSVIAMNLDTGAIRWGHKVEGWDATNDACSLKQIGVTWCPSVESPDFDFGGGGPNILSVNGRRLIGAGQKSGVYWAFDASTGEIVWDTLVGPGTSEGGIEWGTSYDGQRIYVPIADPGEFTVPYKLPNGELDTGGSWAALDPATGRIDWQVAPPDDTPAIGPTTETDGVVFAGTFIAGQDNMFALEAATGRQLWAFQASGVVNSGPAIVNGTVYWGSGYPGSPRWYSTKLYAFSIPGPTDAGTEPERESKNPSGGDAAPRTTSP